MSEDTNGGVGKLLNNNALIINVEIPHQRITGCTNIIYVKKFGNFFCAKLSVNWKSKCIKIFAYFKNSRRNYDVTVIQNFYPKCEVLWRKSLFSDFSTPFSISVNNVKMKIRYQKKRLLKKRSYLIHSAHRMPLHIPFVLEQRKQTLQEALKEALFRKSVSKFPLLKYPFCDVLFQLCQKLNYP